MTVWKNSIVPVQKQYLEKIILGMLLETYRRTKKHITKKRSDIQIITNGFPSHHQQNTRQCLPLRKIHPDNGATQQQQKPDTMHEHAQFMVPLIFLFVLYTLSTHTIRMGQHKKSAVGSKQLV